MSRHTIVTAPSRPGRTAGGNVEAGWRVALTPPNEWVGCVVRASGRDRIDGGLGRRPGSASAGEDAALGVRDRLVARGRLEHQLDDLLAPGVVRRPHPLDGRV